VKLFGRHNRHGALSGCESTDVSLSPERCTHLLGMTSVCGFGSVVASSVLSNGLPWLATSDRALVSAESGQPIILRGINRSGLEYAEPGAAGFLESVSISQSEINHIVTDWGANVLRIPFNQDWVINGRGPFSQAMYLEAIDQIISWTSRAGAYSLIDLHWLDADVPHGWNSDGSCNRVPALPDRASIDVWRILADRYRSEPAVLFDIFNEPHDPLRDDPTLLETIDDDGHIAPLSRTRVTMREWQPWARQLVRAIRESHPRSLIFVPGVNWGYDLRGMPLTIHERSSAVFENIVYTTHVYPWCRRPHTWSDAFGSLAQRAPVFIGEWGGGPEDVEWGDALARYAYSLGIGWTAWSWSDRPRLVVDAQMQQYEETEFGRVVRRHLTRGSFRDVGQRSANMRSPNF
jgi:endoglucanase